MADKLSGGFIISIALIAASLILGGCSNGSDDPSDISETNTFQAPSELNIQSADSLLFTGIQAADRSIQWPADMSDSLVIGYSFVEPMNEPSAIGSFTPGTLIHLSLDDNLIITARVNRNQAVGDNTQSITGNLQSPHTGDITLTVNQNRVTGTVNLYNENRLFYIRYDEGSNRHYIAEINREKLDIQEGSQPLEMN
jgi:hypothetical protein